MITDLTKTFFATFGIEPKYEAHSCDGWGRTVEVKFFATKEEADKFGIALSQPEYPTITDTHYLKLLCIVPDMDEVFFYDVESLKQSVLESLIVFYKGFSQSGDISWVEHAKEVKEQVQELFKE